MSKLAPYLIAIVAMGFAITAGYFTATALGVGTQTPARTVTVDVGTGPAGPTGAQGPPGPAGSPGAESCPAGYTFGSVVFNSPHGQQQIATCLKD